MVRSKWQAYSRLMRTDRPIGSLLLLWPTYWALWIAARVPDWHILIIFTIGVFSMRAAGCVINDFADRKFDGSVERTKTVRCRAVMSRKKKPKFCLRYWCWCHSDWY